MLRGTIALGHIAGIRIGAHWSTVVTLGVFTLLLGRSLAETNGNSVGAWTAAAVGAVALLAALLAHELAHSIVARRHGLRVDRIVLWLLGGVSELGAGPKDPRSDLRIALAGPLTSLALAVGFFGVALLVGTAAGQSVLDVLVWLAATNLLLALFNLLPGAPLDGGRVVRALIWRRTGDQLYAATVAARGGRYIGFGLVVLGGVELLAFGSPGGVWLLLLGWFLISAANVELADAGLRHRLGDIRVREVMTAHPVAIPAAWSLADLLASDIVRTGHQVFPVVADTGHPIALLSLSDLVGATPNARSTATVRSVSRPLAAGARAHENELLSAVASRAVLRPDLDAIVVVDALGRLIGIVTATDLTQACQRSALGLPIRPPHPHRPPNDRG